MFPRIDSPCPLKAIQLPKEGNFNCTVCQREVHDLSRMSSEQLEAFMNQCSDKVCVSYKANANRSSLMRGAVAGVFMVSTAGLALPVMASDGAEVEEVEDEYLELIMVGGVKLPTLLSEQLESLLQDDDDISVESRSVDEAPQLIPIIEI